LLYLYQTQYSIGPIYGGVEKDPRLELEDPRLVPFNVDVGYATGGGILQTKLDQCSRVGQMTK
jgi:hypothetical protein